MRRSASKLQNTVSNAIEKPFLFKLIKYNFGCLSEYNLIHRSTKSFIHGKAAAGNKTNMLCSGLHEKQIGMGSWS